MRYEGGIHPKHRIIQYHNFFTNKISENENVLDIGCGYGALAFSIATKTGAKVRGIDYNPDQIMTAKKLYQHKNLIFEDGDGTKIKTFTNISTIVISNVLEHIHDRIHLLKSIQCIVNPKRWLIRVPLKERDWSIGLREELGVEYYLDSDHKIEYTINTFQKEIEKAGLRVIELNIRWAEIWAEVAL
jgi:2-polyprenyl-3-methyl-5-hydroxy-6-metoxy-1,4-benzoquinol methylase